MPDRPRFAQDLAGAGEQVPDPQWIEGTRLMLAEPALQGEFLKAYAATDLYPVLLAITDDDVPVTLRRSAGRV